MYQNEQIKNIKAIIAMHLDRQDVIEKLRKKIKEDRINVDKLDDDGLVELLKELNLLETIVSDIKTRDAKAKTLQQTQEQGLSLENRFSSTKKALMVTLGQGKAFLDFMDSKGDDLQLQFCVSFLRHKHYSAKVPAQIEPVFKEVIYSRINLSESVI